MVATTWDPSNKSANLTLSGGNLAAVSSSGTSAGAATRRISGPAYFEFTLGSALTGSITIGLAMPGFNNGVLLGTTNNLTVGYLQDGTVKVNGTTISTIATFAATNRIDCAVNPAEGLIWFRVNGGNWNNSGTADPVALVGGISLSTMAAVNFWPAVSLTAVTNQSVTANFSSGSFAGTPPTGYLSVDTIASGGENGAVASHSASYTQYGAARKTTVPASSRVASGIGSHGSPLSLVVVPVASVLAGGVIGAAYSETISVQGGSAPYTFSVASGSLPAGLSLSSSTGVISGTPTTVATSSFTIKVTDALRRTGAQAFSVAVSAPVTGGGNYGWVA